MKFVLLTFTLFIILLTPNCSAQNNTEQTISEIESIIKPIYGNNYSVGIYFADSLLGQYSEGGYYKFEDPNHLLNECVLFSAEDDSGSLHNNIWGIYKDGSVLWHSDPIIDGKWMKVLLIKDINKDSKIEIVTDWYIPEAEYVWIFSWDGIMGSIINDYDNDSTSVDFGCSKLYGNFNSFKIFDYENDGILEFQCEQDTAEVIFSWNGSEYGNWSSTPQVPQGYIFPANRLAVDCEANVIKVGNEFDYSYAWLNDSSSEQSINSITLYNSGCGGEIESPWQWIGNSVGVNTPLTSWLIIYNQRMIAPGETNDSFKVNCNKYPKIVDFYVQGYHRASHLSTYEDIMNDLIHNSFHGYTIGPGDRTNNFIPINFLDTLLAYNSRSFNLNWIKDSLTENKYTNYFTTAKTRLQQSNIAGVKNTLNQVLQDLDVKSTSNLTSEAYALIKYNTEYLLNNFSKKNHQQDMKKH